jgi:hypothetical protein
MCAIMYIFAEVNRLGMQAWPGQHLGMVVDESRRGLCMWKDLRPKTWRKGYPLHPCFARFNNVLIASTLLDSSRLCFTCFSSTPAFFARFHSPRPRPLPLSRDDQLQALTHLYFPSNIFHPCDYCSNYTPFVKEPSEAVRPFMHGCRGGSLSMPSRCVVLKRLRLITGKANMQS